MAINLNPEKSNVTPINPAAIDAWKRLESNAKSSNGHIQSPYMIDKVAPTPPEPPANVLKKEGELEPLAGTSTFNANDAYEISLTKHEEYTFKELSDSIDKILMHIKNSANDGYTETSIDCSFANVGLRNAIKKELIRRGFQIRRIRRRDDDYFDVLWGNRIAWNRVALVGAVIILVVALGCMATCKSKPDKIINTVESTR